MSVREKYAQLPALPPDIMQRLKRAVEVLKRHSVRLAYLFGSAAEEIDRCTDVDIAVLPGEGFSYRHLYADLSLVLNTDRLDLIDLRFAPAYLLSEVLKGKCLFALSRGGNTPPADYLNPVPVFFLAIAPGSEFLFAVASEESSLVQQAQNWLQAGLKEMGVGAKTSADYGYWR